MRLLLGGLFLLLSAVGASAQTAEETVAYIMFHAENDMKLPRDMNDANGFVKQVSKNPAQYRLSLIQNGKNQGDLTMEVKKESDCVYITDLTNNLNGSLVHREKIQVDFSKNIDVSVANLGIGPTILLQSTDQCAFKVTNRFSKGRTLDDDCRDKDITLLSGNLDRVNKALGYLRANFCKGRAF